MMTLPYPGRLILAVVIVLALAQAAPKEINAILVLILVGIVLNKYGAFNQLLAAAASVGKKG